MHAINTKSLLNNAVKVIQKILKIQNIIIRYTFIFKTGRFVNSIITVLEIRSKLGKVTRLQASTTLAEENGYVTDTAPRQINTRIKDCCSDIGVPITCMGFCNMTIETISNGFRMFRTNKCEKYLNSIKECIENNLKLNSSADTLSPASEKRSTSPNETEFQMTKALSERKGKNIDIIINQNPIKD